MSKLINKFSKVFAPDSFIQKNKFKDQLYQIYESTEGRSIQGFNLFYIGFMGFNCYQYYIASLGSFNQAQRENSFILMCAVGVGMIGFKMKTCRTLKNMYVDQNGRHTYLEMYRRLGFSSVIVKVENINFKGGKYFLHPGLKIPMFKVTESGSGTPQNIFLKHKYSLDDKVMQQVINGKGLKIVEEDMQINLSEKQKKRFNL